MSTLLATIDESSPRYAGWRVVAGVLSRRAVLLGLRALRPRRLSDRTAPPARLADRAHFRPASPAFICSPPRWWCSSATPSRGSARDASCSTGACCFGSAVALLAFITALWQLYLVYLLMAVGAATMHVGAISTVVGLWFDSKRPLAISLALNGASSGGILITPALVLAIAAYGFSNAIARRDCADGRGAAAGHRVVDRPARRSRPRARPTPRPPPRDGPGGARCAARNSGAWRRRSRWR